MNRNYRSIFKATAMIGGGQMVGMVFGLLQSKFLALLLGPTGLGLGGMYQSATGLIGTVTGLGIGQAGVRQVAAANTVAALAISAWTLRLASAFCGLFGMVIVFGCRHAISMATFGDDSFSADIGVMALTLLFGNLAGGEFALLTGLRRIRSLALCQASIAAFVCMASVAWVYVLGTKGIAPYLVAGSVFAYATAFWSNRGCVPPWSNAAMHSGLAQFGMLVRLGLAFMVAALCGALVAYLARWYIAKNYGLGAVGLYTAILGLASLYVGIVQSAMGTDFYPALTARKDDPAGMARLINEQTEIGLLLAVPGVLATLTLAPWLLCYFYSGEFVVATELLRWYAVGVSMRIVAWPLGYLLLAKGMPLFHVGLSIGFAVLEFGALVLCMRFFGMAGVGIAYILYSSLAAASLLLVCRVVGRFRWTRTCWNMILLACGVTLATALVLTKLPPLLGLVVGSAIALVVGIACVVVLRTLLEIDIRTFVGHIFNRNVGP